MQAASYTSPGMTLPPLPSPGAAPLSVVLFHLAHDDTRDRVAIGDLLGALGEDRKSVV